jgi:DNA-binding CsgD family transcriptional regulator
MFLSESAIDSRIKNLKLKLGVKNIGGLVASALSQIVI